MCAGLVRAHHRVLVNFEVKYLWSSLFAVYVKANLHFLFAGDLGRVIGGLLRVRRCGVLAIEIVVGLALGDKWLLEGTLVSCFLLLLEEHGHVVPFLLGLAGELVGGVNALLISLVPKLMHLLGWRLVCLNNMVVSDIADVVVDVIVDDRDIVAVGLDFLLFLLRLPLVVDVGDV